MTPAPCRIKRPASVCAVAVAAVCLCVASPARAQERVQNGSFSSGLSGWTQWPYSGVEGGTVNYSPSSENGGSAQITAFNPSPNAGTSAEGIISQCVTVVPGMPYSAFAQAKTISASAGAHFFLYVVWESDSACEKFIPDPNTIALYAQAEFSQSTTWTSASLRGTVPAGAKSASFQLASFVIGAGTADVLFDDASFKTAAPDSSPKITSFTSTPSSISRGQSVALQWATDSDGVCIDGLHSDGPSGSAAACSGPTLPSTASRTDTPTATTTYTLKAYRAGMTASAIHTVTVLQPPGSSVKFEFIASTGAVVYSSTKPASDAAFGTDIGDALTAATVRWETKDIALAIFKAVIKANLISYVKSALQIVSDASNPFSVIPVASGVAIAPGGVIRGLESADQTTIGAWLILDFLGKGVSPAAWQSVQVDYKLGVLGTTKHQPVLNHGDLARMSADRAYFILPAAVDLRSFVNFSICDTPHHVFVTGIRGINAGLGTTYDYRYADLWLDSDPTGCPTLWSFLAGATRTIPSSLRSAPTTLYVTQTGQAGAATKQAAMSVEPNCSLRLQAVVHSSGESFVDVVLPSSPVNRLDLGTVPAEDWDVVLNPQCAGAVGLLVTETPPQSEANVRILPIALDVATATAHYTTELAITNRSSQRLGMGLTFLPSLGSRQGGGTVDMSIAPDSQLLFSDLLATLRTSGLSIPTDPSDQKGGLVRVEFQAAGALERSSVALTARTTTPVGEGPTTGSAGLAYAGEHLLRASAAAKTVFGLRQTARDRSNLAVFNPGGEPVTLRVTVYSGSGDGRTAVVADELTLGGLGWQQISGLLTNTGIESGWVIVERTSQRGVFGAYGVVNDNVTNDGSFISAVERTGTGARISVPVIVETAAFRSELVLANASQQAATLIIRYVESLSPGSSAGGETSIVLPPSTQLLLDDATGFLRSRGIGIPTAAAGGAAGTLSVLVAGPSLGDVFAAARIASPSPGGGSYGLFVPGVYENEEACEEAFVMGLVANEQSRSNVSVTNVGDDADGPVTLEIRCYDGEAGGVERGPTEITTLQPGQWQQFSGFLKAKGARSGWVGVRRVGGTAPWVTYGVINDGGNPAERTGDGAYVPMSR